VIEMQVSASAGCPCDPPSCDVTIQAELADVQRGRWPYGPVMRKVLLLLSLCGLTFNVAVLAALYVPGASYTHEVFGLSLIPGSLTFGSALLVINQGRHGQLDWDRLWDALAALPRWVQVGLGLLFTAMFLYMLASQVGTQTEVGFERMFAVIGVWLAAAGSALHYGVERERQREQEQKPGTNRRWKWIGLAAFVVVGTALAAATFVLGSDPINDEKATHDQLTAQFGDASWYRHLVAANTYHGAFIVYLDTQDATVQASTCADLRPLAAGLGRVPDVYYATGGYGRFVRSC
jgi:hypothetical protein